MVFDLPTTVLGHFTPMQALRISMLLSGDSSICRPTLLHLEFALIMIFHFSKPANISFSLMSVKVHSLMARMQLTKTGLGFWDSTRSSITAPASGASGTGARLKAGPQL